MGQWNWDNANWASAPPEIQWRCEPVISALPEHDGEALTTLSLTRASVMHIAVPRSERFEFCARRCDQLQHEVRELAERMAGSEHHQATHDRARRLCLWPMEAVV
jgi:hypothetical protein